METLKRRGEDDEANDPLIEKFDVKLNSLALNKSILIIQFPTRDIAQSFNNRNSQRPLEVRIKPASGLVEVDVPLIVDHYFNRSRGINFGEALRKNRTLQQGGSLGVPGGLGIGGMTRSVRENVVTAGKEPSEEELLDNFEEATANGFILNKMTYGGRIVPPQSGQPVMCTAVFRDGIMHLTKVLAVVSLQPSLHHLDASIDNEKAIARAQRDVEDPPKKSEAQAINMTAKSADDNEEIDRSDIGKKLRAMQDEPWQRLEWVDEDDERAWYSYEELFLDQDKPSFQLHSAMKKAQIVDAVAPHFESNPNYDSDADWTDQEDSESEGD